MRNAFIRALEELAAEDNRIWLLTGDLGFSVLEGFAGRFPERFLNVGVAEQNMVGIALGLAHSGKVVFTYSIGNFSTLRCLEQIRNDACYHNANVKVVAVGGGLSYGSLGYSHHAVEDLAIMRSLPNITVVAPGDPVETDLATRAIVAHDGPCYLRLGKAGEPIVHETPPALELGKAIVVREGRDVALISTGGMLKRTCDAADLLAAEGVTSLVLSMHTVQPIDVEALRRAVSMAPLLVSIEEHSSIGGLHAAVSEQVSAWGARALGLGIPAGHTHIIGSQDYLLGLAGLQPRQIADTVLAELAVPAGAAT